MPYLVNIFGEYIHLEVNMGTYPVVLCTPTWLSLKMQRAEDADGRAPPPARPAPTHRQHAHAPRNRDL